jgi:hypothetical protein
MKKQTAFLMLIICLLSLITNAQQTCSGNPQRVYQKKTFTLLNPGETIPIYKREVFIGGKGFQTRIQYYFSKDTVAEILPLTLLNVKNAFADNPSFREWIDIYFRNDSELLRYDNYEKIYFLNKVYQISKNNPIKTN